MLINWPSGNEYKKTTSRLECLSVALRNMIMKANIISNAKFKVKLLKTPSSFAPKLKSAEYIFKFVTESPISFVLPYYTWRLQKVTFEGGPPSLPPYGPPS